jgi:hypothetical protein
MNPIEVRYLIHKALLNTDAGVSVTSTLIHPEAGKPLVIEAVVSDPYSCNPDATRVYRITVEEK